MPDPVNFVSAFIAKMREGYLNQEIPRLRDVMTKSINGEKGQVNRLLDAVVLSDEANEAAYLACINAPNLTEYLDGVLKGIVSGLLNDDKTDLRDDIKATFRPGEYDALLKTCENSKAALVDFLIKSVAVAHYAAVQDGFNKRNEITKSTEGKMSEEQAQSIVNFNANIITPHERYNQSVSVEKLFSDKVETKKNDQNFDDRAVNIRAAASNTVKMLNDYLQKNEIKIGPKYTEMIRQAIKDIKRQIDEIETVRTKVNGMPEDGITASMTPDDGHTELDKYCEKLADTLHTNLLSINLDKYMKREDKGILNQFYHAINKYISPGKNLSVAKNLSGAIAQLQSADPMIADKMKSMKSALKEIKAENDSAKSEKTSTNTDTDTDTNTSNPTTPR